jgi:hypothetical protein
MERRRVLALGATSGFFLRNQWGARRGVDDD